MFQKRRFNVVCFLVCGLRLASLPSRSGVSVSMGVSLTSLTVKPVNGVKVGGLAVVDGSRSPTSCPQIDLLSRLAVYDTLIVRPFISDLLTVHNSEHVSAFS